MMWRKVGTDDRYPTLPAAVEALDPVQFTRYGAFDRPARSAVPEGKQICVMLLKDGTAVTLQLEPCVESVVHWF